MGEKPENESSPTKKISDLNVGETVYTTPWAMFADENRHLHIVGSYTVKADPGGTVKLKITKNEVGEIIVFSSSIGDAKWRPGKPSYYGVKEEDFLPAKIVTEVGTERFEFEMLPETYEEFVIERMSDGDTAYVVPWAMFADKDRRLWLVGSYQIQDEPFGTASMKIEKKGDELLVDADTIGDHRYIPGSPRYMGVDEDDFVPASLLLKSSYFKKGEIVRVKYLPEFLEQLTVSGLLEGEKAYTVPWAVIIDQNNRAFIESDSPIENETGGTVQLLVRKESNVVLVDTKTIGKHKYPHTYMDKGEEEIRNLIPVVFIHGRTRLDRLPDRFISKEDYNSDQKPPSPYGNII